MSHKENFANIKELLKNNYVSFEGPSIPLKSDLTFDNKYKKINNAVVVYLDMRHSRKIMFEQNEYRSLKTHRAFLHAFISCIDFSDGCFRSFNGDGALAFFNGLNASSRAVKACMDFHKYMLDMNSILAEKEMMAVDYGVGIATGEIFVAKTGKKGANETRQDLVWVGYPTYLAVELSDRGKGSYHTWISSSAYNKIHDEDKNGAFNILYSGKDGSSIWHQEKITLKNGDVKTVYKTSTYFKLDLQ